MSKPSFSAPDQSWFPFSMQWDDSTSGAATDVSFLNSSPAGKNGYILAKGGHFVESRTGNRIRFLGTNFTFAANFPPHADAVKIAAHLAKSGINIVRIHHEDTNGGMLWDTGVGSGHTQFNSDSLDRLDFLIAQLKSNGIYVDLNLHVSRQFTPADGFPNSVNDLSIPYDKGIDNFNPRMIELNKQFAYDYLTHVNPYTHLNYADDPCVAIIEINNENSAAGTFGDYIDTANSLPEPFRQDIVALWSGWLRHKYPNVESFVAGWFPKSATAKTFPTDVLSLSNNWYLQDQTGKASQSIVNPGTTFTAPGVAINIKQTSPETWHTQDMLGGLDFNNDGYYVITFRAKASSSRTVSLSAGRDIDDWRNIGLAVQVKIGTEWADYRYTFQPTATLPQHNRIAFALGADIGDVNIDSVRISQVNPESLVEICNSYTDANIDIPITGTRQALADWHHFLADTERSYADEMRAYLRNELHVHANIIDTQMAFGGVSSFNREADSDFADNHAYWQHPSFPGRPWDESNWSIANTPMTDALASGASGTFSELALTRVAGKPFTVTEYNHPAPSDYRAEMFPEIASFASAQDWDGIFEFDYGNYGGIDNNSEGKIQGFFALLNDPTKEAFLPSAALIFRDGGIEPLSTVVTLHMTTGDPYSGRFAKDVWSDVSKPLPALLSVRLQATIDRRAKHSRLTTEEASTKSVSTLSAQHTDSGSLYTATGKAAIAASGYLGGQTIKLGACQFSFPTFGNNFAALTLVTLDHQPFERSGHLLLTVMGRADNTGMVWNSSRNSVGREWGTAPVLVEGIRSTVTLNCKESLAVWALGPTGQRTVPIPSTYDSGKLTFTISPAYQTIWYEVAEK